MTKSNKKISFFCHHPHNHYMNQTTKYDRDLIIKIDYHERISEEENKTKNKYPLAFSISLIIIIILLMLFSAFATEEKEEKKTITMWIDIFIFRFMNKYNIHSLC